MDDELGIDSLPDVTSVLKYQKLEGHGVIITQRVATFVRHISTVSGTISPGFTNNEEIIGNAIVTKVDYDHKVLSLGGEIDHISPLRRGRGITSVGNEINMDKIESVRVQNGAIVVTLKELSEGETNGHYKADTGPENSSGVPGGEE